MEINYITPFNNKKSKEYYETTQFVMRSRCRVNKIGTENLNFVTFCIYHATKKNQN